MENVTPHPARNSKVEVAGKRVNTGSYSSIQQDSHLLILAGLSIIPVIYKC